MHEDVSANGENERGFELGSVPQTFAIRLPERQKLFRKTAANLVLGILPRQLNQSGHVKIPRPWWSVLCTMANRFLKSVILPSPFGVFSPGD